ncbi:MULTISPECIES: hypothetical protein [Bacillaceae]|uniref:Uncharacterized protein n=1 Tax=Evansella alkalicola TaxID=745819 RepID=A0ABS6JXT5_9BACI|nr:MULTISPECIES: hypothetical protein [Bacillaceae]MBU9723205.1 hypothetical protein [Bacillus alkalicola]
MYKGSPNLKNILNLSEQSFEELKERYGVLVEDLSFARNAFEFEKASDIKMEMIYIIEELKSRKDS